MKKGFFFVSALCLFFDQFSKCLVKKLLYLNQTISIIPSFFSITYVKNEGAAWSLFSGRQFLLIFISLFALFALYYYFMKGKKLYPLEIISYGLLFGGIFGNLLDRIIRGHVIDFLEFTIFHYHFPVFNIADICIVIGVLFTILFLWKEERHANDKSKE